MVEFQKMSVHPSEIWASAPGMYFTPSSVFLTWVFSFNTLVSLPTSGKFWMVMPLRKSLSSPNLDFARGCLRTWGNKSREAHTSSKSGIPTLLNKTVAEERRGRKGQGAVTALSWTAWRLNPRVTSPFCYCRKLHLSGPPLRSTRAHLQPRRAKEFSWKRAFLFPTMK